MKNKNTAENPRKNNYFVSVLSKDANGKVTYEDIVFTSKNIDECVKFAHDNYTRSVTTAVKRYSELVTLGVDVNKLDNFKNPVLY